MDRRSDLGYERLGVLKVGELSAALSVKTATFQGMMNADDEADATDYMVYCFLYGYALLLRCIGFYMLVNNRLKFVRLMKG